MLQNFTYFSVNLQTFTTIKVIQAKVVIKFRKILKTALRVKMLIFLDIPLFVLKNHIDYKYDRYFRNALQ